MDARKHWPSQRVGAIGAEAGGQQPTWTRKNDLYGFIFNELDKILSNINR